MTITSYNPRTGQANGTVEEMSPHEVRGSRRARVRRQRGRGGSQPAAAARLAARSRCGPRGEHCGTGRTGRDRDRAGLHAPHLRGIARGRSAALLRRCGRRGFVPRCHDRPPDQHHARPGAGQPAARPCRRLRRKQLPLCLRRARERLRVRSRSRMPSGRQVPPGASAAERPAGRTRADGSARRRGSRRQSRDGGRLRRWASPSFGTNASPPWRSPAHRQLASRSGASRTSGERSFRRTPKCRR